MKMSVLARAVGGCVALHSAQGFVAGSATVGRVRPSCAGLFFVRGGRGLLVVHSSRGSCRL